jgi:hypothetical protein
LAGPEYDIPADRVCTRADGLRRLRRFRIGVYPYPTEIMAEARPHQSAGSRVEGLTRGAKYFVDDGRRFVLPPTARP